MKTIRQKNYLFALLTLLAVFAACKGESPTAPPPSGGGTTPPPVSSSLTLTASSANPQVSTTTIISATATTNGSPVPNGTAVEFSTDFGTFTETGTKTALRTTTNGVATVTLTSSAAGTAVVQAVVNNVLKTTSVTFKPIPTTTCPPDCPPVVTSITGISPAFGPPAGGTLVTIGGQNLKGPVRVFFTPTDAGATPKEAFVVSRTDTQIVVTAPPIDLGTGQTKAVDVTVVTQAGTSTELTVKSPTQFTYQLEILTPSITTISPASGPIDGGTNVTIFGDGFQAPVQVFFGSAEARVITVTFKQLTVVSPAARDTAPNGSGSVTGSVDIKVININSNKTVTSPIQFRYTPKMQITAAGPTQGPANGGTTVTIDGVGFNDPVAVSIGGFAAQPIRVSGTQVVAITSAIALSACADVSGPIIVTNVDNGDTASGPNFTYRVPKPAILSVSPTTVTAGGSITVSVANALSGTTKITIGGKSGFITGASTSNGVTTYSVQVPSNFTFATQPCTVGSVSGVQNVPLSADVSYLNVESTCTDTASGILTVNPTSTACVIPPPPNGVVDHPPGNCAAFTPVASAGTATGTATITVSNTAAAGSQSLNITGATVTGNGNGTYTIAPSTATIAPGTSATFTITVDPAAAGAIGATVTFQSNNPTALSGCASGNAT